MGKNLDQGTGTPGHPLGQSSPSAFGACRRSIHWFCFPFGSFRCGVLPCCLPPPVPENRSCRRSPGWPNVHRHTIGRRREKWHARHFGSRLRLLQWWPALNLSLAVSPQSPAQTRETPNFRRYNARNIIPRELHVHHDKTWSTNVWQILRPSCCILRWSHEYHLKQIESAQNHPLSPSHHLS